MTRVSNVSCILWLLAAVLLLPGCYYEPAPVPQTATANPEQGCSTAVSASPASIPGMPDEIPLSFTPLPLAEPPAGGPEQGWTFVKVLPFGQAGRLDILLEIYQEVGEDSMLPAVYYGVLRKGGEQYLIRNLAASLLQGPSEEPDTGTVVCPYLFPGQTRFELIGYLDMAANGPGRKLYLLFDREQSRFNTFEVWGSPDLLDLDGDGADEFVISFRGLHLAFPDVAIIRTGAGGVPEITASILLNGRRSREDFAVLRTHDGDLPTIEIANAGSDGGPVYQYAYRKRAVLEKVSEAAAE